MANRVNPTGALPGFARVTLGWIGSVWKSKYDEITARYVDMPDRQEAQIHYEITQHYDKRSTTMYGNIVLPTEQAIELAKQIVPQYIADAIDAAIKAKAS